MRKFGGVKITMQRVSAPQPRGAINLRTPGDCPCGKSCADCDDEWDRKLGITGRSADQYSENLAKVRRAEIDGVDAYHKALRREAEGVENDWVWTPHYPPGSFVPTPKHLAVSSSLNPRSKCDGTRTNDRTESKRGTRRPAGGSGRRGK